MTASSPFVERHRIKPTGCGRLDGHTFAVKDLLAVAGKVAGSGNPTWAEHAAPAEWHAAAVDRWLAAGATCLGRTITDEFGFSLLGENAHHGTPLNPKAPDRVPGGSSSGSASAVARGDVDLALGTDTGGSVRVPASNCGTWGFRPTHGRISTEGMHPFAPSFDTVGVLARSADVLATGSGVLLDTGAVDEDPAPSIHLLRDALDAAEPDVRRAFDAALPDLSARLGIDIQPISLRELGVDIPLAEFSARFCVLQWAEIWSSIGGWIESHSPELGDGVASSMELARTVDRTLLPLANAHRVDITNGLTRWLGDTRMLIYPTTPFCAPPLGMNPRRDGANAEYYPRTLSQTAIAGLAGLPEVSMPLLAVNGVPMGISLLGGRGRDTAVLAMATRFEP